MALFDGNGEKIAGGKKLSEKTRWRYPRFFTLENGMLSGEDLHHLKNVLRVKQDELVIICDNGQDLLCRMNRNLSYRIIESRPNNAEPGVFVRLLQCVPKSDKLDFIVQKSVELGISEIIPVISKRCVSRPDNESTQKKVARLQKISQEAAKQCGRGKIPLIRDFMTFEKILNLSELQNSLNLFFYECAEFVNGVKLTQIPGIKTAESITLLAGSEGGFEDYEAERALQSGFAPVSLGKRILRADTAPICALSILMSIAD